MPSFLDPTILAGFVALFVAIGGAFLAVNLLIGWLVRLVQARLKVPS